MIESHIDQEQARLERLKTQQADHVAKSAALKPLHDRVKTAQAALETAQTGFANAAKSDIGFQAFKIRIDSTNATLDTFKGMAGA